MPDTFHLGQLMEAVVKLRNGSRTNIHRKVRIIKRSKLHAGSWKFGMDIIIPGVRGTGARAVDTIVNFGRLLCVVRRQKVVIRRRRRSWLTNR